MKKYKSTFQEKTSGRRYLETPSESVKGAIILKRKWRKMTSKKYNQIKVFLLASCMAVSSVMASGSLSGAESGGAKALQAMGNASEKAVAEQVKAFQKEDALQRDAMHMMN